MNILCPECNSENVYHSKKKAAYVCEDCAHRFLIAGQPTRQRLFFSYGHDSNTELVIKLKTDLEARGHSVWLDKSRIKTGDHWRQNITEGLLESGRVVSFLSQHSVRNPGVCLDELRIALCVKGGNIQTVLLDNEADVAPPASMCDIQWLDMSDWKKEKESSTNWDTWYQAKFCELCRVLESEESSSFSGDVEFLKGALCPCLSDTKEQYLLRQQYVGRQWLSKELEDWRRSGSGSKMFVLYGTPGVGKSCFAANLLHFNPNVICGVFCEWDKESLSVAKNVIRTLAFKLAARLPDYRKILVEKLRAAGSKDPFSVMTDADYFDFLITFPFSQMVDGNREKSLILVDGVDEAERSGENALAQVLTDNVDRLPDWISFVVTSRPEYSVTALFHKFSPRVIDHNGSQNNQDLLTYLEVNLEKSFDREMLTESALGQIVNSSQGSFLYATLLVESIGRGELRLSDLKECPDGLNSFYLRNFKRKYPDAAAFRETRCILELLAAAQSLPADILVSALRLSTYDLQAFRLSMGSLICDTQISLDGVPERLKALSFCHKSIIDWILVPAKSGIYYVDPKPGAAILARYSRESIARNKETGYSPAVAGLTRPLGITDLTDLYRKTRLTDFFVLAELWNELEEFLMERDTPLYPYWLSLVRFPKGWDYSRLIGRFWDDDAKIQFLAMQQRRGEQKFVETVMALVVKHLGLAKLDVESFCIYADIVHLGGDYPKAVDLCGKYLENYSENEILSQRELLLLRIRELHHSMFFAPVEALIQKAVCLEGKIDKERFPEEYNEILFLIGGNLGCLHGDFDFAQMWIERSFQFAVRHELYDYECRSARKHMDVLCVQGKADLALELGLKYVSTESDIVTRYQLYLLGALGEVYRVQSKFQLSARCFERLMQAASNRGMPGWQAHALLGMAFLLTDRKNFAEAVTYLERAVRIYERLDQKWGIINSAIVGYLIQCASLGSDPTSFRERVRRTAAQAESLQYIYCRDFLGSLGSHREPSRFHLLFL